MRRFSPILCAILALASLPAAAETRAFVSGALSFGGDTLAKVQFTDGSTRTLKAGGLVQLGGGVDVRPEDSPVSYQFGVGYHADNVVASNGKLSFTRIPVEALVFYRTAEQWRMGAGLRKALSPRYKESVDGAGSSSASLTASLGLILQADYEFSDRGSLFMRYVSEKYEHSYAVFGTNYTDTYSGNHVGVGLSFRF